MVNGHVLSFVSPLFLDLMIIKQSHDYLDLFELNSYLNQEIYFDVWARL